MGIEIELKSVTPSVYFFSDAANPDTARKFYADMQMLTTGVGAHQQGYRLLLELIRIERAEPGRGRLQRSCGGYPGIT